MVPTFVFAVVLRAFHHIRPAPGAVGECRGSSVTAGQFYIFGEGMATVVGDGVGYSYTPAAVGGAVLDGGSALDIDRRGAVVLIQRGNGVGGRYAGEKCGGAGVALVAAGLVVGPLLAGFQRRALVVEHGDDVGWSECAGAVVGIGHGQANLIHLVAVAGGDYHTDRWRSG